MEAQKGVSFVKAQTCGEASRRLVEGANVMANGTKDSGQLNGWRLEPASPNSFFSLPCLSFFNRLFVSNPHSEYRKFADLYLSSPVKVGVCEIERKRHLRRMARQSGVWRSELAQKLL